MKIKSNKALTTDALQAAIKSLSKSFDKKGLTPGADMLHITPGKAMTYNDVVAVVVPFAVDFTAGVKVDKFIKAVESLPTGKDAGLSMGEVIEVKDGEQELRTLNLTGGRASYGFAAVTTAPTFKPPKIETWESLPADVFKHANLCLFSCAENQADPALVNVNFGTNCVESSDRFRVTKIVFKTDSPLRGMLPKEAVSLLYNVRPDCYAQTKEWHAFKCSDGMKVYVHKVVGTFPEVDALFEVKGLTVSLPSSLINVLKRADVLSEDSSIEMGQSEECVLIACEKDKINVSKKKAFGWFKESAKVKEEFASPFSFSINATFLAELLKLGNKITIGKRSLVLKGAETRHVTSLVHT